VIDWCSENTHTVFLLLFNLSLSLSHKQNRLYAAPLPREVAVSWVLRLVVVVVAATFVSLVVVVVSDCSSSRLATRERESVSKSPALCGLYTPRGNIDRANVWKQLDATGVVPCLD
jgi:hypothetical protein